ncbi:MAG TPA: peptidoglycan DD-metalloendopeptidase family protein [Flavobacterium sp.]|jgi:murein DD-endopeptidase MepM/ murein hydrolase activator NlpD
MPFENLFSPLPPLKVIDSDENFVTLDLSVSNTEAANTANVIDFQEYLDEYLARHQAQVAYGGYNEERVLYKQNALFNPLDGADERCIHIGIDFWVNAGTPVLAVLDGTVHSFDYNAGLGNYGPTIILKHELDNEPFYTLYGHLSLKSIEEIEIGDNFRQGEKLAAVGDPSINGNYAPHLHFQLIKDMQEHFGDYPGVCSKRDRDLYLSNCPDPNLLLKLKPQE